MNIEELLAKLMLHFTDRGIPDRHNGAMHGNPVWQHEGMTYAPWGLARRQANQILSGTGRQNDANNTQAAPYTPYPVGRGDTFYNIQQPTLASGQNLRPVFRPDWRDSQDR